MSADRKTDGAGNGTRTRDPQLGRLMLYQLSYSRPIPSRSRIILMRFLCLDIDGPVPSGRGSLTSPDRCRKYDRDTQDLDDAVLVFQRLRYSTKSKSVVVGRGGFEPPKRNATDLQSAPFDHSGTSPTLSDPALGRVETRRRGSPLQALTLPARGILVTTPELGRHPDTAPFLHRTGGFELTGHLVRRDPRAAARKKRMELAKGLEPITASLQVRCSTS